MTKTELNWPIKPNITIGIELIPNHNHYNELIIINNNFVPIDVTELLAKKLLVLKG